MLDDELANMQATDVEFFHVQGAQRRMLHPQCSDRQGPDCQRADRRCAERECSDGKCTGGRSTY